MGIIESFRLAIAGLMANRLRSILTMLGIVIGVSAVIALVSFGQGFQNYIKGTFESIGSNLLFIVAVRPVGPDAKTLQAKPLTMDDVQAIANPSNVSGLLAVAPTYSVVGPIVANGNDLTAQIAGVTPPWQQVRDWPTT